jgi:hypothetical protein
VAVNDSAELTEGAGDVYVIDRGNDRVERFKFNSTTKAYEYQGQFNGSQTPAMSFSEPGGMAVGPGSIAVDNSGETALQDPSVGDVYVGDTGHGVIDKFSSTGVYEGQLTGTCPSAGICTGGEVIPFPGELRGVAVDSSGNVWVYESEGNVDEFSDAGAFVQSFNTGHYAPEPGVVVDSNGNVYVIAADGAWLKFEAGHEVAETGEAASALAINPTTNNLLVDETGSVELYGPFGEPFSEPVERFPSEGLSESHGVAVDAAGTAFATQRSADNVAIFNYVLLPGVSTEPASEVTNTQETLHGKVNPSGEAVTECRFEYGTTASYGHSVPCDQTRAAIGERSDPVAVSAEVPDLQPGVTYHFRLEAANENGGVKGSDETFVTFPAVESESFSDVGSSSATLSAQVNAGGSPTSYQFEYGTSVTYGSTTPMASLGSASTGVGVLAQLSELHPETLYHFRVLATNAFGSTAGPDATFTTLPVGVLGVPDDRGYEMVSPIANADRNVFEPAVSNDNGLRGGGEETERLFQAAANGNAVTYVAHAPPIGGNGSITGNQYLAVRSGTGGWSSSDIEPPTGEISETPLYEAFSSDLSVGFLDYNGRAALTEGPPGERYNVLYALNSSDDNLTPLFTTKPSHQGPGPEGFRSSEIFDPATGTGEAAVAYAGSSANLEHRLFLANDALPSTPEAVYGGEAGNNLYDSVAGKLYLVNVLPNGTTEPRAIFGSPALVPGEVPTKDSPAFSHVISDNGSRVFWTQLELFEYFQAGEEHFGDRPKALYVRENDTSAASTTMQVDAAEPGCGSCASGGGRFWTASSDGTKVFFTDENKLTQTSTAEADEPDLYECDIVEEAGVSKCNLSDLTDETVGIEANVGEHANVRGVVGASDDGSYMYFVAGGVLAANENSQKEKATSGTCKLAERGEPAGSCNLYVLHEGEPLRFIALLSAKDDQVEPLSGGSGKVLGDWRPGLGNRTAEVTPDGKRLVFMSENNLTGYDSGNQQEVYVYNVEADESEGEHKLSCASCNPSGQPPSPQVDTSSGPGSAVWSAFLQPSYSNTILPHWISADGSRVFFDSREALVPQDTNGLLDVYEWEQDGAGSCERSGGCIYLLSGGTSASNSYFVAASESGDDVFMVTRAALVPQDQNDNFDLYDARVGAAQPLSPPVCLGRGCQGVPSVPPVFATPSSVTFSGVGNFPPLAAVVKTKIKSLTRTQRLAKALKACRKRPKRKRAGCETRARKLYGAKSKAKKSAHKGRK